MNKYYKILPEDLNCRGFQYHEGLNIDTNTINEYECSYGLHFSDAKYILSFYGHGTMIAEVELPEDAIVYHFDGKSKADKIILKNLRPLWSAETLEVLIQEGADFEVYKYHLLYEAAKNGYLNAIKYIIEHGANVHIDNDDTLYLATYYGHFDVAKYLVEQGADIHALNDRALRIASENGYLDIVKHLVEHGANIHAMENWAIRYADTPEIEKYLKSL